MDLSESEAGLVELLPDRDGRTMTNRRRAKARREEFLPQSHRVNRAPPRGMTLLKGRITKARNDENTKKTRERTDALFFRLFVLSLFRAFVILPSQRHAARRCSVFSVTLW